MARILLLDETSAAERFSSDQSKNANIGSGTGLDRLSVNTTPFAKNAAQIAANRCVPLSVVPTTALVSLGASWSDLSNSTSFDSSITISSGRSRRVAVCIEGQANAQETDCVDYPTDPSCTGSTTTGFPDFWIDTINTSGQFTIRRFTLFQKPCCSDGFGSSSSRYAYI